MTGNEYLYEKARNVYSAYRSCTELQRKITVKTIISVALTALWYFVWMTSIIRYFTNLWATFNPKNVLVYITAFAILIAPFFVFKPQKWLKFRPYAGKVISAEAKNIRIDRASSMNHLYLNTVSLDENKKFRIKVKLLPGLTSYYKQGTCFVKLRGVEYPVRIDLSDAEKNNEQIICHCCGRFNPRRFDKCFDCSELLWSKNL